MRRREAVQAEIGLILLLLGVLLMTLPKDWIEETVRLEPDVGSGTLELVSGGGTIAVGLALIVPVAFRAVRARHSPASRAVGDQ